MSPQEDGWMDGDAGPVARPYTVTAGRTRPRGETYFNLIDVFATTGAQSPHNFSAGPEHNRILDLCQRPMAVADLAADVGLPLGVVRVLLADLFYTGLIDRIRQAPPCPVTDKRLLQKVLDGLHAL
jgi:hypothetical protein